MKYLTQILALYVLLLATMPCTDGQPCSVTLASGFEQMDQVESHAQNHSHSDEDGEHHDHCTPLCACSCCGLSLLVPDLQDFHFETILLRVPYAGLFQGPRCSGGEKSVWHPPSLC